MKYIKGYLKKNLNKWTNKKWYHQRFDGSPFFMHFIAEAEIETDKEKKKDGDNTLHYCFYENGKADWYILMDDIKKIYTSVIKNKDFNYLKEWEKEEQDFFKKCEEIEHIDLSKLNDEDLIKLVKEFGEIILKRNSSSSIIDGFALGTDQLIADQIKKVYDEKKPDMRFTEVFSILTAPIHLSFINEAELSLLKVSLKEKTIEEHQKMYFWTKNNYVSSFILDVDYFKKEVKKVLSLKIDIRTEIEKINSIPKQNKEKKAKLIGELELDDELKYLIKVSEDFTYWQDERKRATMMTMHYFSLILEEIAKRKNRELEDLKYMTFREINQIPGSEELKARKKNGVYYWDINGMEALHGKEADEVKEKILGNLDLSQVDDFRGLTASLGKARGRVKIIKSATEVEKVKKGDVLVAVMTRPDYVPAMKKASAIVTDEGGVTCHAAIISRELGIPCIIGTKIATKILKDNDLVEVNANHSWVKIIK